jgi:hypothetical protein
LIAMGDSRSQQAWAHTSSVLALLQVSNQEI